MRVFVTGASGFIGKETVHLLRKKKHVVHAMRSRLRSLSNIEREVRKAKPDVVIHLAWEGIPDLGAAMSARNKKSSIGFLRLLAELRIPKIVVTGSCYQHKGTDPGDHKAFIEAKNAVQKAGEKLIGRHEVFIWTYPYFVYGPGKRSGSLIPFLIREAKAGRAPRPKNPNAWHDFVYVEDVAGALALLAEKSVKSGAYDIGSGVLTRTGGIANMIARSFKLPSIRLSRSNARGRHANNRPLTRATGWKPKINISRGLRSCSTL